MERADAARERARQRNIEATLAGLDALGINMENDPNFLNREQFFRLEELLGNLQPGINHHIKALRRTRNRRVLDTNG